MYHSDPPPRKVRSLRATAEICGVSIATLRRRIAEGRGPKITRTSERTVGVRDDHREEWLDSLVEPRAA